MNFKNCADDEDCPVPDEVRESMSIFHRAVLAHCGQFQPTTPNAFCYESVHHGLSKFCTSGVHIEEEEQGEEVDNSLRGRLFRLCEKVKRIREKKEEKEPEPQEDKKPSGCQHGFAVLNKMNLK